MPRFCPMGRLLLRNQIQGISRPWGYPHSWMVYLLGTIPLKFKMDDMIRGYPYFRKPPYINIIYLGGFSLQFPPSMGTWWRGFHNSSRKIKSHLRRNFYLCPFQKKPAVFQISVNCLEFGGFLSAAWSHPLIKRCAQSTVGCKFPNSWLVDDHAYWESTL